MVQRHGKEICPAYTSVFIEITWMDLQDSSHLSCDLHTIILQEKKKTTWFLVAVHQSVIPNIILFVLSSTVTID